MTKYQYAKTIVFFVLILIVAAVAWFKPFMHRPTPMMVQLQDGRILFGDLNGNTICSYYIPVQNKDPKTHKIVINLQPGSAGFGGNGCLEIKENILTQEPLTSSNPAYTQIMASVPK